MSYDYDIIILTDDQHENPSREDWYTLQVLLEDAIVRAALEDEGLRCKRVSWSNKQFDWTKARSVIFRSTWDYFERYSEFSAWFDQQQKQLTFFNSAETIRWNLDKSYLLDLKERGINVVETTILPKGDAFDFVNLFESFATTELVVKPVVSGAARRTFRLDRQSAVQKEAELNDFLGEESFLVQPFQDYVVKQGEMSLMIMGGEFTHAVRKVAKAGDFRVQDDFGGTVHPYFPSNAEIQFALEAVSACDPKPNYARVDMIYDRHANLAIMELELIEPELFFRFNRAAAKPLAKSIQQNLA